MSAALPPLLGMGVSLNGTMNGMDIQSRADALEEELRRQVAARSQAAAQEAQGASQAYQQAAGAPVPEVPPLEAFLNTLVGNTAGVLSGDPRYAQRGQERIQTRQAELLKSRTDNLTALRDVYAQKAELAQRAGDLEATEKFRLQQEKISKLNDQLMQQLKNQQALDLEDIRQQNRESLAGLRHQNRLAEIGAQRAPGGSEGFDPDEIQASIENLSTGVADLAQIPVEKGFRRAVTAEMRRQGRKIMPKTVRKALDEVGSAESVVDEIEALVAGPEGILKAKPGFDRFGVGAKLAYGAWLQTSGKAAQYESVRGGLAGNLARAISAERGVLTDQDRKYAMSLLPSLYDSEGVAVAKIERLKRFIQKRKERAIGYYTGSAEQIEQGVKGEPRAPKPPDSGKPVSGQKAVVSANADDFLDKELGELEDTGEDFLNQEAR